MGPSIPTRHDPSQMHPAYRLHLIRSERKRIRRTADLAQARTGRIRVPPRRHSQGTSTRLAGEGSPQVGHGHNKTARLWFGEPLFVVNRAVAHLPQTA